MLHELAAEPDKSDLLALLEPAASNLPTNSELRVRLAVVHCLGLHATGQRAEAEARRAALRRAYAGNLFLRYVDDYALSDLCRSCAGRRVATTACSSCNGAGQCPKCHGQGYIELPGLNNRVQRLACAKCRKTGRCAACAGLGKLTAPCAACSGAGRRFSPERARAAYLAALRGEPLRVDGVATVPAAAPAPPVPVTPLPPIGPPPSPPDPPESAADRTKRVTLADRDIARYREDVERLSRFYEGRSWTLADLDSVKRTPSAFVGKLVKTRCKLVQAAHRSVTVKAVSSGQVADLIPLTREVGEQAVKLGDKAGGNNLVTVVFGLVSIDNWTLFEIVGE